MTLRQQNTIGVRALFFHSASVKKTRVRRHQFIPGDMHQARTGIHIIGRLYQEQSKRSRVVKLRYAEREFTIFPEYSEMIKVSSAPHATTECGKHARIHIYISKIELNKKVLEIFHLIH